MLAAQEIKAIADRKEIAKYVHKLCRVWKVSRGEVNDIVQDAWAAILASTASFRPDKGTVNQWACGVARNVTRRHIRDAKRYAERFSEYHPNVDNHAAPEPTPEECVQLKEAHCTLSKAVEELSSQQTKVLIAHVVHDLSHGDIGENLGITEAASQKCYQRARNHMAECLDDEALCVMPPAATNCNDVSLPNGATSQWLDPNKWSHYSGQIAAAIIAFLLFVPSNRTAQLPASITGRIQTTARLAMYRFDNQNLASDKPAVYPNVPMGKPEPASLPSVRAVSTPTTVKDKPLYIQQSVPLPPYKPTETNSAHLPLGR